MARLIDDDPRREQQRQERMVEQIGRQFEKRYREEISRAMMAYAEAWEDTGMIANNPEHFAKIETITRHVAERSIAEFGRRMLNAPKSGPLPEHQKDFAATLLRHAAMFISDEAFRRRIVSITDTTRAQIITAVQQGFSAGLGQDGTGKLIRDLVPALSRGRANLISRTETHSAANFGAMQAVQETGLDVQKEWMAALGERTRAQHQKLDGKVVDQGEAFIAPATVKSAAYQIAFPGDPSAPAYGTINCRCALSWITRD